MKILIVFITVFIYAKSAFSADTTWWMAHGSNSCKKVGFENPSILSPEKLPRIPGCFTSSRDQKNGLIFINCLESILRGNFIYSTSSTSCEKFISMYSSMNKESKELFKALKFSK